jgi:hypothetical protein
MAVVTPLNNPGGPEGDTVTVAEQLLNTEYSVLTNVQFEAFAWLQLYRPPRSLSLTHALFLSHTLLFPSHATLNKVITRPESEMIS